MNADQIKSAVLSAMQVVTDEMGLGLAVGPVNELDWAYLSGGFGHLNWEAGLTEYGNMEWSFDVALKLQSDTRLLNAAILGVFKPETDTLEMHFVESFIRREEQHQLKGRVFEMMIIASFLYVAAVGGNTVRLMDVEPELMAYYRLFGFQVDGQNMHQSLADLAATFARITEGD
ncbi:hypothetical protein ACPW74_00120 [Aeromonas sp. INTO2]|uniref:hypothetical protein n=1 Tax=Aeromonas sp. INTO2 TaxID=3416714 RepID=UPI003CF7C4F1